MQPNSKDAPRALAGSGFGETGTILNDSILIPFIDRVKHVIKRFYLWLLEPGEHSRYHRCRSHILERLVQSHEVLHG